MKCYFHPDKDATHSDSVVDLNACCSSLTCMHHIHYKRVPICLTCSFERKCVNTSRVEELPGVLCE